MKVAYLICIKDEEELIYYNLLYHYIFLSLTYGLAQIEYI